MYLPAETWNSIANEDLAFTKIPALPCPFCGGRLALARELVHLQPVATQVQPDFSQFMVKEKPSLIDALAVASDVIVEYSTSRFRFTAVFICDSCREPTCALGEAKTLKRGGESVEFRFRSFFPDLPIFELKTCYPKAVVEELSKSFGSFLRDSSSAGSRARTSIEMLLDALSVPRYRTVQDSKPGAAKKETRPKLTLGERLKDLHHREPLLAELLGGVKQLGNEATHGSALPVADLLEAYDIIQHVLDELYVERPNRAVKLQTSNAMLAKYSKK